MAGTGFLPKSDMNHSGDPLAHISGNLYIEPAGEAVWCAPSNKRSVSLKLFLQSKLKLTKFSRYSFILKNQKKLKSKSKCALKFSISSLSRSADDGSDDGKVPSLPVYAEGFT